jgi:presenilin-like A22 family membrane protease
LLLELFHEKKIGIKILGAVLVALSFPTLYRSSNYYGVTYFMCYIPLYLGFAYYYIKTYRNPSMKAVFMLALFLAIMASFFEHYAFFGIFFLLASSLCIELPVQR